MPSKRVLLEAACSWHASGLIGSPRAASVQLTQALIEELLEARRIIGAVADEAPGGLAPYQSEIIQFLADTASLERFRHG